MLAGHDLGGGVAQIAAAANGHDDQGVAAESIDVHWPTYERHGAAAFVRQIRSLDVNDTLAIAGSLTRLRDTPARVVWGAADQFQKLEYAERFARDLQAPLVRIDGGRHFTPEDHPDVIARALNGLTA
ncbi:MAG: alpha/beta fold hydrolase [Gemmatimonadota bacterium]